MEERKIYDFYDYLLRLIGTESRSWLNDYVYADVENGFAGKFFPDDDERHCQFQSFYELHIDRLEKEGLIVVKRKKEKPIELGLSEIGEYVCSLGYKLYKNEQEVAQKRTKEDNWQRMQDEANERKWNILNNKIQVMLGIITCLSIIGEWVFSESNNTLFTMPIFIAGCLLGYGLNNRINKHHYETIS
ncbi:MAG: hypothetical protein J5905_06365 [Prevotella sp.]|nr:hypothetical protein [Prevotella sp.]